MKKIYNKNAREKQLLEEAYGAIYERRNPDSGTYDAEGESPGPIAELDPDEEEEYHPGYGKVDEGDHLAEAIKEMMKTFLDSDEFEGGLQDAFDITIEQIGDSLGYYNLENIGFTEDEEDNVNWNEKDEVDEVGGGMNSKEFNTINKTTPL